MKNAYVAISTVLVVFALILAIAVTGTVGSVGYLQSTLASYRYTNASLVLESCVDDALIRINEDDALPSSALIETYICNYNVENHTGESWTFTVSTTVTGHARIARINATRSDKVYLNSWEDL